MLKKFICLLFITLLLSGCLPMENGETVSSIDKIEAMTIDKGTITIGKNENELKVNEDGYEATTLFEYANQLPSIVATLYSSNSE